MPHKKQSQQTNASASSSQRGGRFSYHGLDRVLHEKARLSILASLAANAAGILFNDLKDLCSLTDGNLSRHLGVLSDAGLVEIWKGGRSARPQTMVRMTNAGRERFAEYIRVLEQVVADAQRQSQAQAEIDPPGLTDGWSPS